jgi:hypothetical protein
MSFVATAIIGSAVIGAGAGLVGARAQGKAAKKASEAQAGAAQKASDIQYEQWQQARKDTLPWLRTGEEGLYTLSDLMGIETKDREGVARPPSDRFGYLAAPFDPSKLTDDPGYRFRLGEGEAAINRMASATGDFYSGRRGKELTGYAGDMASQEFGNYFNRQRAEKSDLYNRFAGIAGTGQQAAGQLGQYGMETGRGMASSAIGGGAARASGYYGQGQAKASGYGAVAGAATSGIGNMLYLDMMKNQPIKGSAFSGGYSPYK